MGTPVVEDDDEVLPEAGPDYLEQLLRLAPRLVIAQEADDRAVRGVVRREQVTDATTPVEGRPKAPRSLHRVPATAEPRLEVQRTELVEADDAAARRRVRVQVEDPVLLGLELGIRRGLPGLVVLEPDAGLVEDPPELAAADRGHDLRAHDVRPELGQAPGREGFTPIGWSGEGRLHDLRPLVGIDPAGSAPAPARVQGWEPPLVEVVDERGDVGRARPEHRRDRGDALALERGEQEHRPVADDRVLAPARLFEEVSRLLVGQVTDEELGPAGHRHLLCFGSLEQGRGSAITYRRL
jgi:hypothetical protein